MAVANTKSTGITNADAINPRVIGQNFIQKSPLVCAIGKVGVLAADDDNSVYRFVRVPSGARVHSIELVSQAIAGGTAYDIGLYAPAERGGAVVSQTLFATGLDLSPGNTVPVELIFAAEAIANLEQRVWELLGLATDPYIEYDICLTGTTVGTGAGNIALRVEYAI